MFTEDVIEKMIIDSLVKNGWEYIPAEELPRNYTDVMVEPMVRDALIRLNPEIAANPSYADEVIICYDADEAGQKATARAIEILRDAGLVIRVLTVPDGKDPDEFIRKNGERGQAAFKNLIESSGNDVEYRLTKLKGIHDFTRPDSKAAYMKEALKIIAGLDSVVEQDIYCSRLAEELNVRKDAIDEDLNRFKASRRKEVYKKEYKKM